MLMTIHLVSPYILIINNLSNTNMKSKFLQLRNRNKRNNINNNYFHYNNRIININMIT